MADKDAPWFRHDSTAATDPKTAALILSHGMSGYGRWWRLVETLRNEADYRLPVGPRTTACLAEAWKCSPVKAQEFIDYLVSEEVELIATDGKWYWSNSLCRRMANLEKVKEIRRSAGKAGAKKRWQTHGTPIANAIPEHEISKMAKWQKNGKRIANDSDRLIERERQESLSQSDTSSLAPVDGDGGAFNGASTPTPLEMLESQAAAGNGFAARKAKEWRRHTPAATSPVDEGIEW